MRKKRREAERQAPPARPAPRRAWPYALAVLAALLATLEAYGPALGGPFLFDDLYLPFTRPGLAEAPLSVWLAGVRPLLMLSFWLNFRLSGLEPFSYHLFNVLAHFLVSLLVLLIARRLLALAGVEGGRRELLSVFAGAMFLFHPVQTESVAYVASRSETLSGMLFYAALALFLYRRSQAVSWPMAAGVLVLYAAAVSTKEHTAALVALLALTDYFWNPGFSLQGLRRNWRLYAPLALAAPAAARFIWNVVSTSDSAGFGIRQFTWDQYFFTQCRAIWVYLRLFFLPYGQNLDYDFPISRNALEHGAIFGLAGLVALTAMAVVYRRRYPLAAYGWLAFLLLLAPTSSVIPILDPIAERRLYLALPGLLLVSLELLRRWRIAPARLGAVLGLALIVAAALAWSRNKVWAGPIALWQDTVAKSPRKARPHFQLAYAYYQEGRCAGAVDEYAQAARLAPPDYRLLVDWALACDCAGQPEEALAKLRQAAALEKSAHVYSLIGMVYGKQRRRAEALAALEAAAQLDPRYEMTFVYRGNLYASLGEMEAAAREYRHALSLNPHSQPAADGLALVEARR
mgnify:CR=1 FL=1